MGNYGISVTLPTKDVTSTNPRDFVMSSKYSAVKIVQENFGTIVVPGKSGGFNGTAGTIISHNLGFNPMVLIYTETQPNIWQFGFPDYLLGVGIYPNGNNNETYIGTANINLVFENRILINIESEEQKLNQRNKDVKQKFYTRQYAN